MYFSCVLIVFWGFVYVHSYCGFLLISGYWRVSKLLTIVIRRKTLPGGIQGLWNLSIMCLLVIIYNQIFFWFLLIFKSLGWAGTAELVCMLDLNREATYSVSANKKFLLVRTSRKKINWLVLLPSHGSTA